MLAGFLVFAGIGSGVAPALERRLAGSRLGALGLAIGAIVLLAVAYILALPPLFAALIALPDLAKIALSLALIAPLAFFMGMPFPLALARLKASAPHLVPWAWGINGCASVLSAILATMLGDDLRHAHGGAHRRRAVPHRRPHVCRHLTRTAALTPP